MKWIEILQKSNYALLQSESDTQYVVASGYDPTQPENQQWNHGSYFEYWGDKSKKAACLADALNYFRTKTENNSSNMNEKNIVLDRVTSENTSECCDFVECNNCGRKMLINLGEDTCSECNGVGTLWWTDEELEEVNYDNASNILADKNYLLCDTE